LSKKINKISKVSKIKIDRDKIKLLPLSLFLPSYLQEEIRKKKSMNRSWAHG